MKTAKIPVRTATRKWIKDVEHNWRRISDGMVKGSGEDKVYMTAHFPSLFDPLGPLTESATRAASANASLTPRFFIAEHSVLHQQTIPSPTYNYITPCGRKRGCLPRYLNACILLATSNPCL